MARTGRIGILAYGSLISDPGAEIERLLVTRIETTTPFAVEYARYSGSRGGAPTVSPVSEGIPVRAVVLELSLPSSDLQVAKNMLFRRETHSEGSGRPYIKSQNPRGVLVCALPGFCGLDYALYTDFNSGGKIERPEPRELAKAAIRSVKTAKPDEDGISYLRDLIDLNVITALTPAYRDAVLELTKSATLTEALNATRTSKG